MRELRCIVRRIDGCPIRRTAPRGAGGYRFDAATQQITFDGEPATLKIRRSLVTRSGTSVMQFSPDADVFYQCEFGGRSTQAGGDGVPRGSYTVEGVRTGTVFMLTAIRWIGQPDGYILTDFDGRLTGTMLAGRVLSTGCNGFTTTKVR